MTDVASAEWLCTFSRRRTHQTNGKVLERRRLASGCLDMDASNFDDTASSHDETLCKYPIPTPTPPPPAPPDPGAGGGGDATTEETNSVFGMIGLMILIICCCGGVGGVFCYRSRPQTTPVKPLVERFDIEPYSDFSAK